MQTQHDAAEFMSHMLTRLRLPAFTGSWEARQIEARGIIIRDEGSLMHPIALPIQGRLSLAQSLDEWYSQDIAHALVPDPPANFRGIQLLRFKTGVSGNRPRRNIRKDARPIQGVLADFVVP